MKDFEIKVQIMERGINRPYADSIYTYTIFTNCEDENFIKKFCQLLHKCEKEYNDNRFFNENYYTFKKIDGGYIYEITSPYID